MIRRLTRTLALATALPLTAWAQTPPAPAAPVAAGPAVGEVAPDFTLPVATREGVRSTPIKLSDLKGKTVVLAFFPSARTRGCTVQMETYRDQFATLFRGGKDVVVLGVSSDADTTLSSWAKDANFPMWFVSDVDHVAGKAYGTHREGSKTLARDLYVIGPDGRISYKVNRFNVMAQDAYSELGKAVESAAGTK